MGLICGRNHVILFLLILGTKSPSYLFFLPFLFFSSPSIPSSSLSPKTLQKCNFQLFLFKSVLGWVRQPWPLLSGTAQSMVQILHLPVCLFQGWEPCSCLGTTPHLCSLIQAHAGWWSCNAFRAWQVSLLPCAVRAVIVCYSSLSQILLHYTLKSFHWLVATWLTWFYLYFCNISLPIFSDFAITFFFL